MEKKRIALMASYDWSMRNAMMEFVHFLDPVIRYGGKEYKIELTRIMAEPLLCGRDLKAIADFVVDRTTHWNDYYKCWAHQAINSQVNIINNTYTFFVYDKHSTYDLMARLIHPKDHFPTTVLLPQFYPWTEDQIRQEMWEYEQKAIVENTKFGFDEHRRQTNWEAVRKKVEERKHEREQTKIVRQHFYMGGNYLKDAVEKYFGNRFPLYLKKAFGGGGGDVYKVHSLEELYRVYDEKTGGRAFHLQEAIENYDVFVRCIGIGPQILLIKFDPNKPFHEHYSPEKPKLDKDVEARLIHYALFINSYHRWTYNSLEAIVKEGRIFPIDFANACPDSHFTSLHVHFPWVICSLLQWITFCAVTAKDMKADLDLKEALSILNDPKMTQGEKYRYHMIRSREYFDIEKFKAFCQENFSNIKEKMIEFYDACFDDIIHNAIHLSDFPKHEHERFYHHYKAMMEKYFRPNAMEYLSDPGIPEIPA